jgi:hypothetical protein
MGVSMSQLTEIFLSVSQLRKTTTVQRKLKLGPVAHFWQKSAIALFKKKNTTQVLFCK